MVKDALGNDWPFEPLVLDKDETDDPALRDPNYPWLRWKVGSKQHKLNLENIAFMEKHYGVKITDQDSYHKVGMKWHIDSLSFLDEPEPAPGKTLINGVARPDAAEIMAELKREVNYTHTALLFTPILGESALADKVIKGLSEKSQKEINTKLVLDLAFGKTREQAAEDYLEILINDFGWDPEPAKKKVEADLDEAFKSVENFSSEYTNPIVITNVDDLPGSLIVEWNLDENIPDSTQPLPGAVVVDAKPGEVTRIRIGTPPESLRSLTWTPWTDTKPTEIEKINFDEQQYLFHEESASEGYIAFTPNSQLGDSSAFTLDPTTNNKVCFTQGGEIYLTLHPDGRVEFSDKFTSFDAAKAFAEYVQALVDAQYLKLDYSAVMKRLTGKDWM